jgi:hypothetical protein
MESFGTKERHFQNIYKVNVKPKVREGRNEAGVSYTDNEYMAPVHYCSYQPNKEIPIVH